MMNLPKEPYQIYNLENKQDFTCNLCECPTNVHICGWACPIFEGNAICSECCLLDALRSDIDKKFSAKLGRDITKEEINEACKNCGKNNATQNEQMADNLENQTNIEVDTTKLGEENEPKT
jgi:hypothetical protein